MTRALIRYFDIDGTVAAFTADPAQTVIDTNFTRFALETEDDIVIVTGREDKRVNPETKTHTVDIILKDILDKKSIPVISCHGLACVTAEGDVYLHPALEKARPAVITAQQALPEFLQQHPDQPILLEEKMTGITLNVNNLNDNARDIVLQTGRAFLQEYASPESGLDVFNEHGSIELRPICGKAEGVAYFISNNIVPGTGCRKAFSGDSFGEEGTDRKLADTFVANADIVIQVSNAKPDYAGAAFRFPDPAAHCKALVSGFSPFEDFTLKNLKQ